jgi:hypothetical protein
MEVVVNIGKPERRITVPEPVEPEVIHNTQLLMKSYALSYRLSMNINKSAFSYSGRWLILRSHETRSPP